MLPLADMRVVAVEQFGAGPWATMQLADLGADVIKIEDPSVGGDVSRYVPPFNEGRDSLFFETFNRNKRSITLDLRRPDARRVLEDIVAGADAVFSNLRGDQPAKLRLRYRDFEHVNPRIVCVSLSGFGGDGPRAAEGGYDYTIQALAGWMSVTGGPDEPPTKSGLSLVDFAGGYVAAVAMTAGVWQARRDGKGFDVDLSLFDSALHLLAYMGTWSASRGWVARRLANSAHQSMVPFQAFEAADGWLVVACPKQSLWLKLCDAVRQPELARDDRFADFAARDANRAVLVALLQEALSERSVAEWLGTLTAAGVPCAPVQTIAGALADPQAAHREALVEYEHPILGRVRQVASPLRLCDGGSPPVRRAPRYGEHTDDVLAELCGYSPARIQALRDAAVFGAPAPNEGVA
jgi:crotonobetainyl-CoA:carnitine CoA-transferase CaiB-like acyl-CoA transferase